MTSPGRPVVYFHIGVPKTGTTYLQHVLASNRDSLRRNGLLYPGAGPAAELATVHYHASVDLRGATFEVGDAAGVAGSWDRLVHEVAGWPQRSLIDHESFASARQRQIERARADLEFADLHIVVTARDLARQIPAVWQERVKNRSTASYRSFLEAIQAGPRRRGRGARRFWRTYGLPQTLRNWGAGLDPSHVHVVTVPPSGSDPTLLWHRFARLLGVEPDSYDATPDPHAANRSLGAAEAALLRRFNEVADDLGMPWPVYHELIKHQLAIRLSERRTTRIELPQPVFDFAVDWSRRTVAELAAAGYDVVGDLEELIPRTRPIGADPDTCPADDRYEAALAATKELTELLLRSSVAEEAMRRSRRGAASRALAELADRLAPVNALREAYRRARS